jgi:hypothetical protein
VLKIKASVAQTDLRVKISSVLSHPMAGLW